MKRDTHAVEQSAIAVLQSLNEEKIWNQKYLKIASDFDRVLKKLKLKTAEDKKGLKFLLDQIRSAAITAEDHLYRCAALDKGFIEGAALYKEKFAFNLEIYAFRALLVLDFFGLRKDNTVTVAVFEDAEDEEKGKWFDFIVNDPAPAIPDTCYNSPYAYLSEY